MRVLIIKTSSLGDVIHTLPAVTDAARYFPSIQFDWVVERSFAEIPSWHPQVDRVIPIAWRQWRKHLLETYRGGEWQQFYRQLRLRDYDYVIDAQGLIKSAFVTRLSQGMRCGFDFRSARESFASFLYQKRARISSKQHAVTRVRQLFANILEYAAPETLPDYQLDRKRLPTSSVSGEYVVFLHGTTWETKHWPENYWIALAERVNAQGMRVLLPWGNSAEYARAQRIAAATSLTEVLPKLNLAQIAAVLANAKAAVAVDTGLGHLATALAVPTLSLYGPTNPNLTGTYGKEQQHLAAPFSCAPCLRKTCNYPNKMEVQPACFTTLSPDKVWQTLQQLF